MLDESMRRTILLSAALSIVVNVNAFTTSSIFGIKTKTTGIIQPVAATLEGRVIEGELVPINNFILVKKTPDVDQTEGGIVLTGKSKIKKTEGTVVSTGPGKTHQESGIIFEIPVVPGDGVVFGKYDGTELDYNGEKHTLIRDDDILVKYTGSKLTLESADVTSDNILVYVEKKEEETSGGLLIAASSSKGGKPSTGKVVKVGPGRMASNGELMEMDISVGDMVKFRDFAANEVKIGDEEYAVVRFPDLLAKF
jgi:chaperonin GroES